jgi:acetyl esterase/lipase
MTAAPTGRRSAAALLLPGVLVLAGCGSISGQAGPDPAGTGDYLPGRTAATRLPRSPAPAAAPVVLLLPGGSGQTADPTGLRPLAAWLARHGVPAVTATYRAAGDGILLPDTLADTRCAAAYAGASAGRSGRPRPVVLLGHSSGAHLAALVALAPGPPTAAYRYRAP